MKGHGFSHTKIELHDDGSATVHHVHESGDPSKDVRHAAGDLDEVHDSLEQHLNPEEIEKHLEKEGMKYKDIEALEEKLAPGIHAKLKTAGGYDKEGNENEDLEEKLAPGIHEKMLKEVESKE